MADRKTFNFKILKGEDSTLRTDHSFVGIPCASMGNEELCKRDANGFLCAECRSAGCDGRKVGKWFELLGFEVRSIRSIGHNYQIEGFKEDASCRFGSFNQKLRFGVDNGNVLFTSQNLNWSQPKNG